MGAVRGRRWHGENTVRTGAMRAVGGGSGQGARSRHVSPRAAAAGAGRAAAAARGGGRAASAGALLFGPALPRPRRRGRASPLESAGRRRRSCKKRGERSRSAPGRGGERGGEAGPRVASRRVAARRALGSSAARAPLPARPSPPGEPSGRRAAYRHGRTSPCAEGASSPRRALSALLRRLPGTPKAERSSAPRRLSPRPERQEAIGWIRVQCRRERAGP